MKNLFIISAFHYNYFINNVNATWVSKNLFRNGNNYFYFLTYNSFKIEFEHNIFKKININKYPIKHKIGIKNDYDSSIDYIKKNINNFNFYFLYPENIFSYQFQMYSFIKYLDINKYYVKNNEDIDYLDQYSFSINSYIEKNKNDYLKKINFIILKKAYITMLSNICFSFFYSKTTTYENIDLLFLMIDNIIKDNINKSSKNIYNFLQLDSENKYINLYKLIGNNLKYIYMNINFENDTFNILNKDTYEHLPYKYELKNEFYYSKEKYDDDISLNISKFNFEEIYIYMNDWYSIEEIYYKMLNIYEYININEKKEIEDYFSPINIHISTELNQIITDIDTFLINEDYNTLHLLLNGFYNTLKLNYKEKAKELIKCPFCIDGKIYNGKDKFFCNKCNFFLIKSYIKKKYNFILTKRYLKILIKNKYITINFNGENRILFLRNSKNGIFLTLLRKK